LYEDNKQLPCITIIHNLDYISCDLYICARSRKKNTLVLSCLFSSSSSCSCMIRKMIKFCNSDSVFSPPQLEQVFNHHVNCIKHSLRFDRDTSPESQREGEKFAKAITAAIDVAVDGSKVGGGSNAILPLGVTLPFYQTTVVSALMRRN